MRRRGHRLVPEGEYAYLVMEAAAWRRHLELSGEIYRSVPPDHPGVPMRPDGLDIARTPLQFADLAERTNAPCALCGERAEVHAHGTVIAPDTAFKRGWATDVLLCRQCMAEIGAHVSPTVTPT